MIPALVCRNIVEKYSILDQEDGRWTARGREPVSGHVVLQVSELQAGPSQRRRRDIMKAGGGRAVSRCAASNGSQMFCWPRCCTQTPPWAPTGLLAGSSAAPAGSLSCSHLSEAELAAAVGNKRAGIRTLMLHLKRALSTAPTC